MENKTYVVVMIDKDGNSGFMDGFTSFEEALEAAEVYQEKGYILDAIY